MALWLRENETKILINMDQAIKAVETAFCDLYEGSAFLPQRVGFTAVKYGGGGAVMPAFIGGDTDTLAIKVVTAYKNNPAKFGMPTIIANIMLLNPANGELLALMDGSYLTALRTGAVSGVATRYLARKDAKILSVFGAGVQGEAQVRAICTVRKIEKIYVIDIDPQKASTFSDKLQKTLGVICETPADIEKAVKDSDIIATATTSAKPLFKAEWLKPGTHINGIGSHAPAVRELDTKTIAKSLLVVDQREACLREAGDIIIPITEKVITEDHICAELGGVISRRKVVRKNNSVITCFKSVGLAIQDAAVASIVYKNALKKHAGQELLK
ncbi:MAG: hypothetical protein DRP57_13850 [Spirochaetes bacterium]|nr:MAG: hypothetical protein DRP57_13850 [Spirochaetota bacterium]